MSKKKSARDFSHLLDSTPDVAKAAVRQLSLSGAYVVSPVPPLQMKLLLSWIWPLSWDLPALARDRTWRYVYANLDPVNCKQ